jgi:hypothetical protein
LPDAKDKKTKKYPPDAGKVQDHSFLCLRATGETKKKQLRSKLWHYLYVVITLVDFECFGNISRDNSSQIFPNKEASCKRITSG